MFDIISLWIGRFILAIIILCGIGYFLYTIRFVFRRPYYCIKHLLPWKHWTFAEWNDTCARVAKKRFDITSKEWIDRIHIHTYWNKLGIIHDCGKHLWWEPTNRFFWIKK